MGGGLGVLGGIIESGCAEAAGAGPRLIQPSSWPTCPRSSKPSWADQVEEEGEDGESALSPPITTASPPGRHCCLFQSPTLAPPSDPASPLTASPCPAPSLSGPAYLQFRTFTSSSHATAQILDPSTAAPLLRGGSCNSLPPAFVLAPGCQGSPMLAIAGSCYSQLRVPRRLSQDTSWPVVCPRSRLSQLLVRTSSQSSLHFGLGALASLSNPCSLHSLSQTNVSPASSSRGSLWPPGIPAQSLNYCREVSDRLLSVPGLPLLPSRLPAWSPFPRAQFLLCLPLSQLHCRLPRRSSMETSRH